MSNDSLPAEQELANALYMALAKKLITRILEADANCDEPHDIELRLYSIINERDQLRKAANEPLVTPDTGHAEADRILSRLASSDPDFDDCTDAAVLIRKLVVDNKGPDGYATWKDAAIAERLRRVSGETPDAQYARDDKGLLIVNCDEAHAHTKERDCFLRKSADKGAATPTKDCGICGRELGADEIAGSCVDTEDGMHRAVVNTGEAHGN